MANRKARNASPGRQQTAGAATPPASEPAIEAQILYDEIIRSRDRLADLPPLTPLDIECAAQVLHEVVWFLITPPGRTVTPLPLPVRTKSALHSAARNRDLDLYVTAVALLARKTALWRDDNGLAAVQMDALRDALDALTFDYRAPKRMTLSNLREIRADLDARIAYVATSKKAGYRFSKRPELYSERESKSERADRFFERVYAVHVSRGLTQADIRHVDPAFYNVLHVWCTRHERKLSSLVPATRTRRD